MWDIKNKIDIELDDDVNEYYLNHVGYKGQRCLRGNKRTYFKYYLNHVGYKANW